MLFNTWRVVNEKWWTKYYSGWLCSQYKWRHNNDVIFIQEIQCVFVCVCVCMLLELSHKLNFLQNVYFGFFIVWKLTEWCCFVSYLWNDHHISISSSSGSISSSSGSISSSSSSSSSNCSSCCCSCCWWCWSNKIQDIWLQCIDIVLVGSRKVIQNLVDDDDDWWLLMMVMMMKNSVC